VQLINGSDLFGTLPAELGLLTEMLFFYVKDTPISGSIPSQLGALVKMTTFKIENGFAGKMTGTLPKELSALANLKEFRVTGGQSAGTNMNWKLTGTIPPEYSAMTSVTALYIFHNANLSGSIPPEFSALTNLRYWHLKRNAAMTGTVPSELTTMTKLSSLDFQNTGFCVASNVFVGSNFELAMSSVSKCPCSSAKYGLECFTYDAVSGAPLDATASNAELMPPASVYANESAFCCGSTPPGQCSAADCDAVTDRLTLLPPSTAASGGVVFCDKADCEAASSDCCVSLCRANTCDDPNAGGGSYEWTLRDGWETIQCAGFECLTLDPVCCFQAARCLSNVCESPLYLHKGYAEPMHYCAAVWPGECETNDAACCEEMPTCADAQPCGSGYSALPESGGSPRRCATLGGCVADSNVPECCVVDVQCAAENCTAPTHLLKNTAPDGSPSVPPFCGGSATCPTNTDVCCEEMPTCATAQPCSGAFVPLPESGEVPRRCATLGGCVANAAECCEPKGSCNSPLSTTAFCASRGPQFRTKRPFQAAQCKAAVCTNAECCYTMCVADNCAGAGWTSKPNSVACGNGGTGTCQNNSGQCCVAHATCKASDCGTCPACVPSATRLCRPLWESQQTRRRLLAPSPSPCAALTCEKCSNECCQPTCYHSCIDAHGACMMSLMMGGNNGSPNFQQEEACFITLNNCNIACDVTRGNVLLPLPSPSVSSSPSANTNTGAGSASASPAVSQAAVSASTSVSALNGDAAGNGVDAEDGSDGGGAALPIIIVVALLVVGGLVAYLAVLQKQKQRVGGGGGGDGGAPKGATEMADIEAGGDDVDNDGSDGDGNGSGSGSGSDTSVEQYDNDVANSGDASGDGDVKTKSVSGLHESESDTGSDEGSGAQSD
jgi:hypothetical protein